MTISRGLPYALGVLSFGVLSFSTLAAAQPVATFPSVPFVPQVSGGWTVSVGLGGQMQPSYPGANSSEFKPFPMFSVRRAGSKLRFRSMRDNASFALIDEGAFRAGPTGAYRVGRKSSDHRETWGLNDVNYAIEIGGFAEYYPSDWLRGRAEVRRGFNGHEGVVAEFAADVILPVTQQLTFAAGPRYTLASNRAAASYYNISAAESLASGLPAYEVRGASHAVGAGGQLRYTINPQWDVLGWVEYDRLLGSVADSPIVARGSRDQLKYGIGANYSFDIGIR